MITMLPLEWNPDQIRLAAVVTQKAHHEGDYTMQEVHAILTGMMIGGPLGNGCPQWKIRPIAEAIAAGPGWKQGLFGVDYLFPQAGGSPAEVEAARLEHTARCHHTPLRGPK